MSKKYLLGILLVFGVALTTALTFTSCSEEEILESNDYSIGFTSVQISSITGDTISGFTMSDVFDTFDEVIECELGVEVNGSYFTTTKGQSAVKSACEIVVEELKSTGLPPMFSGVCTVTNLNKTVFSIEFTQGETDF